MAMKEDWRDGTLGGWSKRIEKAKKKLKKV
jgi:hypothetical protein